MTEDGPPVRVSVDDIVASGRREQRRRRTGFAAAGLAMVAVAGVAVATAVSVPAAQRTGTATAPAANPPAVTRAAAGPLLADPFEFTFSAYSVGPVHVQDPIVASNAYQIASVLVDGTDSRIVGRHESLTGPSLSARLTVYRPGAYAAQKLGGANSTVAGHRALKSERQIGHGPSQKTLAWEYAPNAWAVLESIAEQADLPTMQQLEATAGGLTGAAARPAKAPFTLSYIPAGYQLFAVGEQTTGSLDGFGGTSDTEHSGVLFAKKGLPKKGLLGPYDNMMWGAFQIMVSEDPKPAEPGCIANLCSRLEDGKVTVEVASNAGSLSPAEMRKVLDGIKLTDVRDKGSWADIRP
ncbi:hypothetical protein AB0F81_23605 [Actinoplanes sp. NPDC024001]|uniref:hypothetical protein n=1 Tax=Actinoplanes sp. NPDC024001 TaxID=3154598 RepID=UPI0033E27248